MWLCCGLYYSSRIHSVPVVDVSLPVLVTVSPVGLVSSFSDAVSLDVVFVTVVVSVSVLFVIVTVDTH